MTAPVLSALIQNLNLGVLRKQRPQFLFWVQGASASSRTSSYIAYQKNEPTISDSDRSHSLLLYLEKNALKNHENEPLGWWGWALRKKFYDQGGSFGSWLFCICPLEWGRWGNLVPATPESPVILSIYALAWSMSCGRKGGNCQMKCLLVLKEGKFLSSSSSLQ